MASQKIPEDTISLIRQLYSEGIPVLKIARRANVSYPTAYCHTRAVERGFNSRKEYEDYLARQRGFKSKSQYMTMRKREQRKENSQTRNLIMLKWREEVKAFREKRNKELSDFLNKGLNDMDINKTRLASRVGVTKQAISVYSRGRSFPSEDILKNICNALGAGQETLEVLLGYSRLPPYSRQGA